MPSLQGLDFAVVPSELSTPTRHPHPYPYPYPYPYPTPYHNVSQFLYSKSIV